MTIEEECINLKYLSIMAAIFFGELAVKNHVERNYTEQTEKQALGGRVVLRRYHNRGACLNLGEKNQAAVALLSAALTFVTLLVFVFSLGTRGNAMLRTGLAILLGGAFSNTYDRLKRRYVVDYFSFRSPFHKLNGIVFNLADFAILIGALLAAWHAPAGAV